MVAVFKENFVDTKVSNVNALKKKDNHIKKLDNLANDFKNNVIKIIQDMHEFDITKFTRHPDERKYVKMNNSVCFHSLCTHPFGVFTWVCIRTSICTLV